MLKLRLQGTKNDIRWFLKILSREKRLNVKNTSPYFDNKGTSKNKRLYTEVYRKNEKTSEKEQTNVEPVENNYFGSGKIFN
ncbi:MAG: hypothetical protein NC543_14935 [bacterium]|nr:hypothetical protein [bacterium]MCM1376501.1 hypothetical protein [Muribaculum sp.]MCM1410846.1 hypothetical protein [Lachnospiraceae bacterium]